MSGTYKSRPTNVEYLDISSLGRGVKIIYDKVVPLDVKMATFLLETCTDFPGERPLRQNHVNVLVSAMMRGTYRPEQVILATCRLDGKEYRMNGQHTAWARLEVDGRKRYQVRYIRYEASTEHDLRQLYASIDRGTPRTKGNVITSYLAGTEEFEGISNGVISHLSKGFALWRWESKTERGSHDGDDIAVLLKTEYFELARKVADLLQSLSQQRHRFLFRASTVGAMFATFGKTPQNAEVFWKTVADGVAISSTMDPRGTIRDWLMMTQVTQGRGAQGQQNVSAEYMYRACIQAWNKWRDNGRLQIIRPSEKGKRTKVR